jgi:hypothetical protein
MTVPPFLSYGVHTSPICLRFGLFRPLNPPILGQDQEDQEDQEDKEG